MRTREEILHWGEREAQRRFRDEGAWPDFVLNDMITERLRPGMARFMEAQRFFFMATASDEGHCDCSFRATERGIDGKEQPLLKVLTDTRLVFPDYSGNKLYNSIGNILTNPHIGLLFINFERAMRLRVNGRAMVIEDRGAFGDVWSTALRYIAVDIEQAYGNCPQRIPMMAFVKPQDA